MERKKNPFGTIDANENVRKNVEGIINIEQPYEQPVEEKNPAYSSYDDIYKMLSEQKVANDAQAAGADRRARLAKTQEAIGGIYDLGRAIANLYGTTQYAPNINLESMSDKARERYEKAIAEREGYKDAAMNYALRGATIKAQQAAAEQQHENWARNYELNLRKQEHKELYDWERLERDKSRDALNAALAQQKIDNATYNAITNRMRTNSTIEYRKKGGSMTPYIVTTSYEYDPLTGKVLSVKKERNVDGRETIIERKEVKTETTTGSQANNSGSGNNSNSKPNNGSMPGVNGRNMPGVSSKK